MANKKLLTIDDLFEFCLKQKVTNFSSKNSGYSLSVQIPSTFEVNEDESRKGLLKLKIKIFHIGLNRNQSFISEDSAKNAMSSIKNRPILAAIHKLDSGEYDFEGHNYEIITNEDGEEEIRYIESQVGSFTEESPFIEHDDGVDKDFICAYAIIPEEYTKTAEIIRRKQGTKNSCELVIEDFSFNAKEKYLELNSFYLSASTLLGSTSNGTEIGEGMLGSRADITEFSSKNNSLYYNNQELEKQMIGMADKLDLIISSFNIEGNTSKESMKGGQKVTIEQLCEKYNVDINNIPFEIDKDITNENLEKKFIELYGESNNESDETNTEEDTNSEEDTNTDESNTEEDTTSENADESNTEEDTTSENADESNTEEDTSENTDTDNFSVTVKEFTISLTEKLNALWNLVNDTYGESDSEFYGVDAYEEDNIVIMIGFWNGRNYRQSFKEEGNNFNLVGDRIEVYTKYLSQEEIDKLESFKSSYEELKLYKENSENNEKDTILSDNCYSEIIEEKEFKELITKKTEYSIKELEEKANTILGKFSKQNYTFKDNTPKKKTMFGTKDVNVKQVAYGGLFKDKK